MKHRDLITVYMGTSYSTKGVIGMFSKHTKIAEVRDYADELVRVNGNGISVHTTLRINPPP